MNDQERNQYLIDIGNRIKQLRIDKELSQDELAKRCGYTSRSTINKIELGINDIPQSKIKAIAEALGVCVGEILCWDEMDQQHDTKQIQNELKEVELSEAIRKRYGETSVEVLRLYAQLDIGDQGEVRGTMKQMLKDEKYTIKKELSSGKAI